MLITIGSLFITQAYWFKKSFTLQESQFEEKLNIALRNVANKLLILEKDSTSQIAPISKISSNEFYVRTDCYYSLSTLDSCIKLEFSTRDITVNFDYLVLQSSDNKVLLGNTIDFSNSPDIACKVRDDDKKNYDFKIRLNNKTTYLLNSMGIWMYSSLSLLLILGIFTFIMISILKEKKLSQIKNDFVNNMTHELKTPIANISVASEAIRNKNIQMDESKLQKYTDIIFKENKRLHNLVDHVLQISFIEKKEESLHLEKLDIHQIIKSALISFEPIIQQREGQYTSDLKAEKFILKGDKIHLQNVIYNLIDNAIKYSKDSPTIKITTFDSENGINIKVIDNGIGISKENQSRIFDKFYRIETGNLHNTKGFGLGLSYVKLIVEKHNGLVTFESKKNKGSSFNVFLPL
jgi:two-component system phosphate regulon sensor histidine kinase PhoR